MGKEADSAVDMEGTLHKKMPRFAHVYGGINGWMVYLNDFYARK